METQGHCSVCDRAGDIEEFAICKESDEFLCDFCTTECIGCNEYFKQTSQHNYTGVCRDCEGDYLLCQRCSEVTHYEDSCEVADRSDLWCNNCVQSHCSWCNRCEQYFLYGCENCYSDSEDGIHDYNYRPDLLFKFQDSERPDDTRLIGKLPYLGMELEMEASHCDVNDGVEIALDSSRDESIYYLKSDGSLDYGFELVTHPATLSWFMDKFPWHAIDNLRREGMRSYNTSTCGVHIHINRRAFVSAGHLWKFCHLINKNQSFSESIAGRRNNSYASFHGQVKLASAVIAKKMYQDNRYASINLQNHSTVEVRIFKGTLKVARLKTYLQFVDAVYQYTKDLTIHDCFLGALRDAEFAQWVLLQSVTYPELSQQQAIQAFNYGREEDFEGVM